MPILWLQGGGKSVDPIVARKRFWDRPAGSFLCGLSINSGGFKSDRFLIQNCPENKLGPLLGPLLGALLGPASGSPAGPAIWSATGSAIGVKMLGIIESFIG